MKKTFLFAMLGLVLAGTALESCKKGADDPAISFRSRKGRFAGDWKLSKGTKVVNNGSNTFNYAYDGATQTTNGGNSIPWTVTFSTAKDGSYTMTTTENSGPLLVTIVDKGRWNFIGKIGKDFKNKDHVILYIDSEAVTFGGNTQTDTYTGDQNSMVMYLDELKNKELRVKMTQTHTDVNSGTTSSDTEDYTMVQ